MMYARAGETVTCENGHPICDFAQDVRIGEPYDEKQFTNWRQAVPEIGSMPACEICGAPWFDEGMVFHLEDGWRDPLGTMEPASGTCPRPPR